MQTIKKNVQITAANFLGEILLFSKNLYLFCACLMQLIAESRD